MQWGDMDNINFTRRVFFLWYVLCLEGKFSGRTVLDNKDVFHLLEPKSATECEGVCKNLIGIWVNFKLSCMNS